MSVARAGKRVLAGVYFPEPLMTASICRECCGLGARVEEKKSKGGGRSGKGRKQQKKHAGFQFPKSLMSASNSHECRGLGARRRMQNRNQTKDGKCKQRRGEEGRPKG